MRSVRMQRRRLPRAACGRRGSPMIVFALVGKRMAPRARGTRRTEKDAASGSHGERRDARDAAIEEPKIEERRRVKNGTRHDNRGLDHGSARPGDFRRRFAHREER
ncbi:hypothetical protein CYMTET_2915 [Cymbomonas tetramitiformis]|uniref:Uncharacterized protein n=1 Tax=Cymbomonas tetramitiformis TaxID=36881 RepID=A0AAE0F0S0_9CHLO|nr:hypothetical protein CYMTET_43228 [Cymbomonas tetramitiformis]KAK3289645.1 hypothetical protein CYMTET_2915 [Cymbomonas tetramitiformis]